MCIKKDNNNNPLAMPLNNNGIVKKPKKPIPKKPSAKKQLTVNELVNNYITKKVVVSTEEVQPIKNVRFATRAFIAIMLHTLECK